MSPTQCLTPLFLDSSRKRKSFRCLTHTCLLTGLGFPTSSAAYKHGRLRFPALPRSPSPGFWLFAPVLGLLPVHAPLQVRSCSLFFVKCLCCSATLCYAVPAFLLTWFTELLAYYHRQCPWACVRSMWKERIYENLIQLEINQVNDI